MAICDRLQWLFGEHGARFELLIHREEFSAERVAQASHVPGGAMAKVVVLRDDAGQHWMAVLPASCRLDLVALGRAIGHPRLSMASEKEMAGLFPDCEVGAMPPFGDLYGMPVVVDACFPRARQLFFQAGNHRELIGMPYQEYERLAHPTIREFCLHERAAPRGH